MNSKLFLGAAAAALLALACADRPGAPEAPAAPELRRTSDPLACDFNDVNRSARRYFSQPTLNQVRDLLQQMQQAGARTATARERGFDVMVHLAAAADNSTGGSPSVGSDLTRGLIRCMFDPADGPDFFPDPLPDFTVSLDPAQPGAFAVRGPSDNHATPILSRDGVRSGIAPAQGNWSGILGERVLIYGFPAGASAYDWSMVRPGATFATPGAIVGLCETASDLLVRESSVGLLPYADAFFLVAPCPVSAAPGTAASLFAGLRPVARFAASLVAPRPLHASAYVNPGGVGGVAGGLRSVFSTEALASVDAAFVTQPLDGYVGQPVPTSPGGGIVVAITAAGAAFPSPTEVRLFAVDNNGAPEPGLYCPGLLRADSLCIATTDGDGLAAFGNPVMIKPGAYRLETGGNVLGRSIAVTLARSDKYNVRP